MSKQNTDTSSELGQIEKEYKREVAITEARPLVYRIMYGLWLVFDIALVGLLVVVVFSYLISGQWSDRQDTALMANNLLSIHSAVESNAASAIFVGEAIALRSGDGYDFHVELENPNDDWYASFEYVFETSEGSTKVYHGFIFPGETRTFVALNEEFDSLPSQVEMTVDEIQWRRMDAHSIDDLEDWYSTHSDFEISDALHSTVEVAGTSVVRSSFTVTNDSPYGYWTAPFILVLERNGVPVGVNQVSIAGFEAGETREVDLNWFDNTPSSGTLVIHPWIDFLDEDVYMSPSGEVEVDVRDIKW